MQKQKLLKRQKELAMEKSSLTTYAQIFDLAVDAEPPADGTLSRTI